jgi:hypothetical protein
VHPRQGCRSPGHRKSPMPVLKLTLGLTLKPRSRKTTKSKKLRWPQSSMLSDLPGQPREGGPSWARFRFAPHPWRSVWSADGPKTCLGALVEEVRSLPGHEYRQREPQAGLTLESNLGKNMKPPGIDGLIFLKSASLEWCSFPGHE